MASYLYSLMARSQKAYANGACAVVERKAMVRRFADETSGSIAIMFALILVALCLFVGGAVDIGRWLNAQHQTTAAADAAVLAGARMLQLNEKDVAGARAAAQKYYLENTKGRSGVVDDTIAFDAVDNGTAFAASGSAYLQTTFLNFAHVPKLRIAVPSKALLRAGGKANDAVEISMMLDVTGSMGGSKITDLKKAANDLVAIVISDSSNYNPVRVAIVPFAEGVRLPSSANAKARGTPMDKVDLKYTSRGKTTTYTYYPTDCVVERTGTNKYTDAAPGSGNYVMTLFNDDNVKLVNGKSYGTCGLPAADELVPLTNDKVLLKNRIDNLVLSGATAGQIGTAWAWYTLSPNWNSLWATSAAASAYGSGPRKIAILMTDGEYNLQYDVNGVSTNDRGAGSAANSDSTTQARAVCTAMKAKGITVYTVGFALGSNATAITTLKQCATNSSMAYTPDSGAELQQAFRDIALKINQLYLTQ
ncbi:TadE/TadG family type IV pilus assembly protein [Hyphomicrobium sp.]|uniref:TadE/TadG family type IV pilus assembly protein n=1 Tax=Hyphomicrobium sp. TaxID=82 RepID=UPI002E325558|nr:TadE/TadG family type IV pilus assembly protein [Hyphomicrobium sp.]HEX2840989.1 TadE/TadG family type IV pilus assembly protein [Hyphomicrobium sp.]